MSISHCLKKLGALCENVPPQLLALEEVQFSAKPSEGKWSKKEILGHLIDSAANNHQRFIRGQFEETPRITYDQNAWNTHSYYNGMESRQLILFWEVYNRQLLALLQLLSPAMLTRTVDTGGPFPLTMAAVAGDYVAHLEHHLQQILPLPNR